MDHRTKRLGDVGLTIGCNNPEDLGNEVVREGSGHHEEERRILLPDAPELQLLEECLACRYHINPGWLFGTKCRWLVVTSN